MKLSELLRKETIIINLKTSDKWQAIGQLVARVGQVNQLQPNIIDTIEKVVLQREKSISTATGEGLAIPHASTDAIKQAIGALAFVPEGLEFEAIDLKPVYMIVLVIIPQYRFKHHIRTIANVAKVMHSEEFRNDLLTYQTPDEILEQIKQREEQVF